MKINKENIIIDLKRKLLEGEDIETIKKELNENFNPRTIVKMINKVSKEIVDENLNYCLELFNEQKSIEIVKNNLEKKLPDNLIKKVLEKLEKEIIKESKTKVKDEFENSNVSKEYLTNKYSNVIVSEKQINQWIKEQNNIINAKNKDLKNKFLLISSILILLCLGPIFDYFYHFSMFSRDPALDKTRIISNLIFFIIYFSSATLFIKKKYWARWVSFILYLFWTSISIMLIILYRHVSIINLLEVFVRVIILWILLKSAFWFNVPKKTKI